MAHIIPRVASACFPVIRGSGRFIAVSAPTGRRIVAAGGAARPHGGPTRNPWKADEGKGVGVLFFLFRPGGAKEIFGATKGRLCPALTPRLRVVAQATTLRCYSPTPRGCPSDHLALLIRRHPGASAAPLGRKRPRIWLISGSVRLPPVHPAAVPQACCRVPISGSVFRASSSMTVAVCGDG